MHKVRQAIRKHRKLLSACAMVLAIALMFWAVNSPAIVGVSAAKRVLPIYSVQRDDRVVSLTFDAAWGNEDTQTLIDILGKYNVHATFFVVGEWVDKYPESVKALADAGNEVMNHSSRSNRRSTPAPIRSKPSPARGRRCFAAPTESTTTP